MTDSPYPSKEGSEIQKLVRNGNSEELREYLKTVEFRSVSFGEFPIFLEGFDSLPLAKRKELVEILVEHGWTVDEVVPGMRTLLVEAIRNGDFEFVEFLKNRGAKTSYTKTQWYSLLSGGGVARHWKEIIDCGIEFGEAGDVLFSEAVHYSDVDAVRGLIEYGVDPARAKNEYGWPAFVSACTHRNLDLVKLLLEAGADIDAETPNGQTGLMRAVFNGDIEVIGFLIENGARLDAVDNEGKGIGAFLEYNKEEVARYLSEKGVPVTLKPDIDNHVIVLEASDRTVELEFHDDSEEWGELYNSGGLVMGREPEQFQNGSKYVGLIKSPHSLARSIDIVIEDASLVSGDTEKRLRSFLTE